MIADGTKEQCWSIVLEFILITECNHRFIGGKELAFSIFNRLHFFSFMVFILVAGCAPKRGEYGSSLKTEEGLILADGSFNHKLNFKYALGDDPVGFDLEGNPQEWYDIYFYDEKDSTRTADVKIRQNLEIQLEYANVINSLLEAMVLSITQIFKNKLNRVASPIVNKDGMAYQSIVNQRDIALSGIKREPINTKHHVDLIVWFMNYCELHRQTFLVYKIQANDIKAFSQVEQSMELLTEFGVLKPYLIQLKKALMSHHENFQKGMNHFSKMMYSVYTRSVSWISYKEKAKSKEKKLKEIMQGNSTNIEEPIDSVQDMMDENFENLQYALPFVIELAGALGLEKEEIYPKVEGAKEVDKIIAKLTANLTPVDGTIEKRETAAIDLGIFIYSLTSRLVERNMFSSTGSAESDQYKNRIASDLFMLSISKNTLLIF